MHILALFTCLIIAQAAVIREKCSININGTYYDKETLVSDLDRPVSLNADRNSDNLYFGYKVLIKPEFYRFGKINLRAMEFIDIPDVSDGLATAINYEGKEIFVGGAHGIYKYDIKRNKSTIYGAKDKYIWKMYYSDILYFSSYPDTKLFTFNNGNYSLFEDLKDTEAQDFIIDDDNMMYFHNNTGLYRQKKGTKDSVLIMKCELLHVRALAISPNGKLYACLQDGVYLVNKDTLQLEKLFDVFDAFGLTFDSYGNFIYSDSDSVYRLLPNTRNC